MITIGNTIRHMVEIDGRVFAVQPTVAAEIARLRGLTSTALAHLATTRPESSLHPCRFCGEREHLSIDRDGFERVAVVNGKVSEVVWKNGDPTGTEHVDAVTCQVCDCMAPLDVWNGTRPVSDYELLRDFDTQVATTL